MKILIDLGHPAHAHFFKYIIGDLAGQGHEVKLAAREREMLYYLLDRFGFEYTSIGRTKEGLLNKAADLFKKDMALLRIVDDFKPDLMLATGSGSPYSAQVAKLKGIPNITCTDTEHARFINWLTLPFTEIVCTPECYTREIRSKYHVRYNGYHELAYLHPNRFTPAGNIRERLGIDRNDKLILLKFAQWTASHDLGVTGFAFEDGPDLVRFVKDLEEHGRVLISSEMPLPDEVADYEIDLPYELIHDLIAESDLYFGEGATMASEAAVLGVPSIFISTLRLGYLDELQQKYGLVYSHSNRDEAMTQVRELLTDKTTAGEWKSRREKMLKEKIDVSKFISDIVMNFPKSIDKYRL
jgi:predicted glycosyltransferase